MNTQEADVLRTIAAEAFINQRILAENTGHSLGVVNRSLKTLCADGYLNESMQLTDKAKEEFCQKAPRNAIILAAGYGMRMAPINLNTPKALLEIHHEPLIERQINQLQEVGITDITIVIGFMKESFDYLIDQYGVELVVNPEYAGKNNLASIALVADRISNTYIVPSDIWCEHNPFMKHELYSWYMVSDQTVLESDVRVNRKKELVRVREHEAGNQMVGITYLLEKDADRIRHNILNAAKTGSHDDDFWEISLYEGDRMSISARIARGNEITEINTYEQLRELDGHSSQLKSEVLDVIAEVFHVTIDQIKDISVLKKGMTNRSFLFSVHDEKYIMRVPGEGTDQLIDRAHEAEVYEAISSLGLCDDPTYIDPDNGYKITKFLDGVRTCNPESTEDLVRCMEKLRIFHQMNLSVNHTFDIFGQMQYYEELWDGQPSMYKDYQQTKEKVLSLRTFIDSLDKTWCLTHIDAVPDNFLFYTPQGTDEECLQLTDWEYSGMQDPHVDIAMFCIYSLYNKEQTDKLIDIYFENKCDRLTRAKIYAYIAICGLLWSNWCEFKRNLGVEFGEYSMRQYRYAKDYYRYAVMEGA